MKITRNTKRSTTRKPTIACSKKRMVKSTNRKVKSACGKKSVKAASRRNYDPDTAVGIFYESLDNLNRFFKGTCVFNAVVGSYNMPKCTSYYEHDGVDFMRDLNSLIKDNSGQAIMEWIGDYETNPLYLAVINGTEDEYIQEHISGEDMNNIDPTVDPGFVDEWYDMFDHDCYLLGVEIADQICGYLSYFSDIVAEADGSYDYEDDFYEVRVNYFGDKVTSSTKRKVKASRRTVCASSFRTDFQKFLGDVDREVSDALYQYDDAVWDVKGTISPGDDGSYWFELNLWCDGEEAGTVNIEYNGDTFLTNTDAYVVSVPDSDEIQAEGNSFADIYDTCVGELIRLAEDYVNFVR